MFDPEKLFIAVLGVVWDGLQAAQRLADRTVIVASEWLEPYVDRAIERGALETGKQFRPVVRVRSIVKYGSVTRRYEFIRQDGARAGLWDPDLNPWAIDATGAMVWNRNLKGIVATIEQWAILELDLNSDHMVAFCKATDRSMVS